MVRHGLVTAKFDFITGQLVVSFKSSSPAFPRPCRGMQAMCTFASKGARVWRKKPAWHSAEAAGAPSRLAARLGWPGFPRPRGIVTIMDQHGWPSWLINYHWPWLISRQNDGLMFDVVTIVDHHSTWRLRAELCHVSQLVGGFVFSMFNHTNWDGYVIDKHIFGMG